MTTMWKSLFLVLFSLATALANRDNDRYQVELYQYREYGSHCHQTSPNCSDCLSMQQCSWCSDGIITTQCVSKRLCSRRARIDQCEQPDANQDSTLERDFQSYLNSPPSLGNSSKKILCSERRNCSFCTSSQGCLWCYSKNQCIPDYGASNASQVCGGKLWYKNQCLYSSTITPCPQRTGGCKDCLSDKMCYWCKSSGNCSYFPYDAYVPPDCSSDDWFYDSCSKRDFLVVLLPILAIIFAPVVIFIVIGISLCCMRKLGVKGLDDGDEKEKTPEDSPKPEKKPSTKMSHKPAPSRVDELKKKYNLGE